VQKSNHLLQKSKNKDPLNIHKIVTIIHDRYALAVGA